MRRTEWRSKTGIWKLYPYFQTGSIKIYGLPIAGIKLVDYKYYTEHEMYP